MTDLTMERSLGRVEGKLDALITQVTADRETSHASRAGVYLKLEDVRNRQALQDEDLKQINARLDQMAPTIKKVERWEQRGVGVAGALVALGAVFGTTIALLWKAILHKLGIPA